MNDAGQGAGHATPTGGTPARAIAGVLVSAALLVALAALGLALADPSPSRHVRGLLITVDLVLLVGVVTAWLRVVRALGARAGARPGR
ncbi:hypothetical protein FAIPA1_90116 [Frankia sp. AiPs1]|uniref:hypothetical protein n=1 Tax=Frankia sp. AiPa1 TaxID=573492 RepID=UPI00202AF086|nr:hypothetical protein [Frankia sp. AiPa1]MCL9760686.1 hypothetical protein [Frankia sp. AiPa1]